MPSTSSHRRLARFASLGILVAAALAGATSMARAQGHPAITRCTPMIGPPGTRVRIVGLGFRSASVYLGEHLLRPVRRTATEMIVVVPVGATSGLLLVTIGDEEEACGQFEVAPAAR
ncbi:MAG: IPT/TIG domain-containing protein [Deltaproteobacteria bacterium]